MLTWLRGRWPPSRPSEYGGGIGRTGERGQSAFSAAAFGTALAESIDARETVGAPVFRAHAVVNGEQAIAIVVMLHFPQARVVRAPERALPVFEEMVALGNVGAGVGNDLVELPHGAFASRRVLARSGEIRLVSGNAGERGRPGIAGDRQREGIQHLRMRRRIASGFDRVRLGTGQSLVEMQRQSPVAGNREQRINQVFLTTGVQQGLRQPFRSESVDEPARLLGVAGPHELQRELARFERAAFTWLAAVASVGVGVALAIYGRGWWAAIERAGWLHSQGVPWLIVIAICGLLSHLFARTLHSVRRIGH